LWKTSPPTVPRRREAPTTATARGRRKLLEALRRALAEGGRQLDVDRAGLGGGLDREAALAEDLDHAVVLRHHLGEEGLDPVLLGDLGEVGEQDRPQPLALELVGDREGDLGAAGAGADVGAVADRAAAGVVRPAGLAARRDEAVAPRVVDFAELARRGGQVARPGEEAERARVGPEPLEQLQQRRLVPAADRPQVDGGPVPQHDVRFPVGRILGAHPPMVAPLAWEGLQSARWGSTSAIRLAWSTIRGR
jgi:hypothetical protein